MRGIRADLVVPLDGIDPDALLESWRWRVPRSSSPLFATALGDLFLRGGDGRVCLLDVGDGELWEVALDLSHFEEMAGDSSNTDLWFARTLVDKLIEAGSILRFGECFSYVKSPLIGGLYESSNFRVYDLLTHFRVWGPIHRAISDIPDGTSIEFAVT